ncbi:P1 family peptidase [Paralimibaculum aggregatum]|uniref:P1 family peptidase n=1 Tax=Paralimibaculum aggregatum TaxID=3036245 RepID=A0ABQ6LEQ0_9RHOB|nr:P1 family peptidase [Limibaculum sp. NKW23]GMG81813.1 P1 family peptidase [Limibaculum sp. NKW23]
MAAAIAAGAGTAAGTGAGMLRPGPRNLITDVAGLAVGNAEDPARLTGTTVVLPDGPCAAAADVRGGGPGTRETDLLALGRTVRAVHALVLSGGSAYGLAAADGAMDWLRRAGRGFRLGAALVPIVPAAVLFDLLAERRADPMDWDEPPWRGLGQAACAAAGPDFALGNAGAGRGATVGHGPAAVKGGLGSASVTDGRLTVGALAAVNPAGRVTMPGSGCYWAWWLEMAGELGGLRPPAAAPEPEPGPGLGPGPGPGQGGAAMPGNTTLGVVATDAALDRDGLARVAAMAQDGLARAIRPVHGPLDGDVVFALATGRGAVRETVSEPAEIARIGALAADCLARAVMRGAHEARGIAGIPALRGGADPAS